MNNIIQVENLSKRYIIGHQHQKGGKTFREAISQNITNLGSKFVHPFSRNISANSPFEEFWALKDICFEVEQGDRIGIIGKNGAGKSTLLKVLSRITEPTSGKITIGGRVASLLEVGTGFNGELTGRENIFLNGAILGMHNSEIKQKFDEIVDFAGVEKFLDTPVKRYSSGMSVRLAFAVAAHLEPEILIIDEVLAVGDAEFQKKCLGKMQDVSQKEGRTVVFVSHYMPAILALCNKTLILDKGKIVNEGTPDKMVNEYLTLGNSLKGEIINTSSRDGKKLIINSVKICNENGETNEEFSTIKKMILEIQIEIIKPGKGYSIGFHLLDSANNLIFISSYFDIDVDSRRFKEWEKGQHTFHIEIPPLLLKEGDYYISVASTIPCAELLDQTSEPLKFRLFDETNLIFKCGEGRGGIIMPILNWQLT